MQASAFDVRDIKQSGTTTILIADSKAACPDASLNALWKVISSNKYVMGIIFILIGTFVCFLGRKLFAPILFIAGILLGVALVWIICYSTFLSNNSKGWVFWLVLGISILIGLLIGCLLFKLSRIGAFLLAGWGGYCLALLLYNAFLYKINSQVFFWCWTIGLAIVCGLLCLCLFEHVLILATAMAGAFLAVAGIGVMAGGYQNPFTIVEEIKQGTI